jgi:F-type H+-transporting ATPase subunit b
MILLLVLNLAMAAGGAHGDNHIPVMTIVAQAVNLTALVLLLVFLTRKQVKALFKSRRSDFEVALQRARAAKEDAESRQREILSQLKMIEDTYEEQIKKAELKAEQVRLDIVAEAKNAAARIRQETEATYKNELNSAIASLKKDLLLGSIDKAEELLKTKMQKADHENLQDSLMKTIGANK